MPAANADFVFEPVSDLLNIRVLSDYILREKEGAFQAIAGAIKEYSAKAVLVDFRASTGPYTFMDKFELGEMAGRHLRSVPVAVIATEDQVDPDRIGKVVARNRGANVEVFTDLVEAQEWLKRYL